MFTPQQIDQISFRNAAFNGYDKYDVDEFLEPLTEDYITLYKENALLKSKMKVLVSKLEEYRRNEASMKEAMAEARKTCEQMIKDAEAKCTQLLTDANAAAAENSKNAVALIAAENARVEDARRMACHKIDELQDQLSSCIKALERIKENHKPAPTGAFDYDQAEGKQTGDSTDAVADEISANLQALVGTADEVPPKTEPQHPTSDTTSKFGQLKFGPNYNPTEDNN